MSAIRNFCIIAHIDHGKSTLADRLLEITGTVEKRAMKEQLLDSMDLERERGITIKLQPATMEWQGTILNLIDTPGHVDFSYEVSRSLAACEGAILLVDASQGIEAQTVANVHLAVEHGLEIIPVAGKMDLPAADLAATAEQIEQVIGLPAKDVLGISGKTGEGVEELLQAIVDRVPAPQGKPTEPLRALIFDSAYDTYRGVVAYVRVMDGALPTGAPLKLMATGKAAEASEVGVLKPDFLPRPVLKTGEVGYVVTNLKNVTDARVGDTITGNPAATEPLPGYAEAVPMVFAGLFTASGEDFAKLREGLEKLSLNDAALSFDPVKSSSLGLGFRGGFLGLLHLDIVRERLTREYGLDLIVTAPSVSYEVKTTDGQTVRLADPVELPDPTKLESIAEPWVAVEILARSEDVGAVMPLIKERRGIFGELKYLTSDRVMMTAELPLASLVIDFYDVLKGATAGYASLSYTIKDFRTADLVRLDFLIAEEPADSLSLIVHRQESQTRGQQVLLKLKELIPRAQFQIALQAAIGGKIIARENISPVRKNVTAGLYGGDVTRKRKQLEKQKKGKARLKASGRVRIPPEAFLAVLRK